MSFIKPTLVQSSPTSGQFYPVYTVPTGVTFFCTGVEVGVQGATTTASLIAYDGSERLVWTTASQGSRDFSKPVPYPAGTVISAVWNGTGTPVLICDLLGYLQ